MFNLLAVAVLSGAGYGLWSWSEWLRNDKRILCRQAASMAKAAAAAARNGEYAERDRLDDARAAVLTSISNRGWPKSGSDHDDYMGDLSRKDDL